MKNNALNEIVAKAVKEKNNVVLTDRKCQCEGNTITVILHEKPCMTVNGEDGIITVNGKTPATRKSVRLINTILALFVQDRVITRTGTWYLVNQNNVWQQFSGKNITLNIS